jgi:hypothetical protein
MARTLIRDVSLLRPQPQSGARLPPGYGLAIGAAASAGLWLGLAKLMIGITS